MLTGLAVAALNLVLLCTGISELELGVFLGGNVAQSQL